MIEEAIDTGARTRPAQLWRTAAAFGGAQIAWLTFTSVGQTVTLRIEELLDALGASPDIAERALDAWALLPIAALGAAFVFAAGRRPLCAPRAGPIAAVALVTLACAVFYAANRSYLLHRLLPVREHVLYRSAQMGEATLRGAIDRYGIRTLVVLRNSAEVLERERRLAASLGVRFAHIPMDDPEAGVERFLALVGDAANHPMLVHCRYGVARTGVASAAYRMEYDGWDNADALAEARRIGGWDTLEEGSHKRDFILSYAPGSR